MSWKELNPLAREERGSKKTPRWRREGGEGAYAAERRKEYEEEVGEQPGDPYHSYGELANATGEVKEY